MEDLDGSTHLDDPGYPLPTHDQFMQWIGLAPSAVAPPPVPEVTRVLN